MLWISYYAQKLIMYLVSLARQSRFACLPLANAKPHTSHLNGLSPVWSLLWDQSEEYRENVPSQTLQWNGFSAWFWLFCLPPEIERINKILVFLEGPVLQKWYARSCFTENLWTRYSGFVHRSTDIISVFFWYIRKRDNVHTKHEVMKWNGNN